MSSAPYFKLYFSDLAGDTLHLSDAEMGSYVLLIGAMWNAGGRLPDSPVKLARIARVSPKVWPRRWAALEEFFTTDDGFITHKRVTVEREKVSDISAKRSDAGTKGGTAKALKNKEQPQANATETPKQKGKQNVAIPESIARKEPDGSSSRVANAPLVSEAKASSGGSADPPARVRKAKSKPKAKARGKPAWERDPDFAALWDAATPSMRTRSMSRDKLWPIWRDAKAKAGAGSVLVEALKRYVAEDGDVSRSGGPRLERWLREGRWQHWTGEPPAPAASITVAWPGPPEIMAAVRALPDGERLATGYLAKCGWREGDRVVFGSNSFVVDELRKQAGSVISGFGAKVLLERAA